MTRAQKVLVAVFYAAVAAFLFFIAFDVGKTHGRAESRAEHRDECYCGTTQTCAFGPGIVGVQACLTSLDRNEWGRCEPDPNRSQGR